MTQGKTTHETMKEMEGMVNQTQSMMKQMRDMMKYAYCFSSGQYAIIN